VQQYNDQGEILSCGTLNIYTVEKLFAGGTGTEEDPYLISNKDELANITTVYDNSKEYKYYKVITSSLDLSNWTAAYLNGSFDGNGVVINNLGVQLFRQVGVGGDTVNTYVVKNITINANININGYGAALIRQAASNLVLENITVHGTIEGNNGAATFVCFGPGNIATDDNHNDEPMNWVIKNCYSDATIIATGDVAVGFIKHPYCESTQLGVHTNCLLTIEDSIFEGSLAYVGNDHSKKYFTGNGNAMPVKTIYSEEFIAKYGNPEGKLYGAPNGKREDGSFFIGNYASTGSKDAYVVDYALKNTSKMTVSNGTLPANRGDVFTVNKADGAVSAKITLEIAPNDKNNYGAYLGTYMFEVIDISAVEGTFNTNTIKYFNIAINADGITEQGVVGDTYNVYHDFFGTTYNGASVRAVQYDANGNIVSITTFAFAK
ncbi:MAG: hypothetical protein IKA97_05360, partial [Clostridia bacterium]|nr:hypothetical protein [Clostridia bacterium]